MLRFLKFSIIGGVVTLLSFLFILIFNEIIRMNYFFSYVLTYVLTLAISYILNTVYTFKANIKFIDFLKYSSVYISGMILGVFMLKVSDLMMDEINKTIRTYCIIPFTMFWNYYYINKILKKENYK